MQKFVIKKISRSTNITISSTEEQNLSQCSDQVQLTPPPSDDKNHLENQISTSSVRMCGYLKKKRNFGGWTKLFFVLQNSLLMSYNSKEEYEEQLKSFKDVILIIPGNTVLLPSLEPRFTIASNLNTFYTFRCDDNKTCSKWITAILECLSRDIHLEYTTGGKKALCSSSSSSSASSTSAPSPHPIKNFFSQQNLNINGSGGKGIGHKSSKYSKRLTNLSWENLQGSARYQQQPQQQQHQHHMRSCRHQNNFTRNNHSNWIVNHNGRILLELNMLNCNRAKLPIASQTAKILKNCTDNDVIRTTKKINFLDQQQQQQKNDENQNHICNGNNPEIKVAHDTHHNVLHKPDQFRLHNDSATRKQSREVNRISKMFPASVTAKEKSLLESESQRPDKLTQSNGTDAITNEIGIEEQEQAMSFDEEYSLFNTGDYASVDSTRFNNKLNIENTYSEVESNPNGNSVYAVPNVKWIKSSEPLDLPEYSVVDLTKKYQERLRKQEKSISDDDDSDMQRMNDLIKNLNLNIYEDIEIKNNGGSKKKIQDESNIYELIEIPAEIKSPRKSKSLTWRTLHRINIFDIAKRFKLMAAGDSSSKESTPVGTESARKRQKPPLTLNDFSKHFNYRSMRNKAKKFYRKSSNSASALQRDFSPSSIDNKKEV